MQRRNFLKIMGGGVILAAGGVAGFVGTRTPTQALAPWSQAGQYDDPRMNALSYAILSPNPHNRQPWIVRLDGDDALTLFFDTDKQLEHTDPLDRQLTIGLGCFWEMLRMAANADGYDVDVTLFPEGESAEGLDQRSIATVRFAAATPVRDPLFDYVMARRSNKEPFDTSRPVPATSFDRVLQVARHGQLGGSIADDEIAYWRQVATDALTIEIETPRTFKESVDLFRIGKFEINANPDGIDLGGALFETLSAAGLLTRDVLLDPTSFAFSEGLAATHANTQSAMGHLWLVTEGNSRVDQIATGADWLRVNLACTAEGLAFQPLSQALQEYDEMAALYAQTHQRLAPNSGTVQMLARIGYGPDIDVSPRWPITAKIGSS